MGNFNRVKQTFFINNKKRKLKLMGLKLLSTSAGGGLILSSKKVVSIGHMLSYVKICHHSALKLDLCDLLLYVFTISVLCILPAHNVFLTC